MKNKMFQDYVRSGVFTLTLSKGMVDCLTYFIHKTLPVPPIHHVEIHPSTYAALERRGLIRRTLVTYEVTSVGRMVYELLAEADLIDWDKFHGETETEAA